VFWDVKTMGWTQQNDEKTARYPVPFRKGRSSKLDCVGSMNRRECQQDAAVE
jgi:hypothetical protein